MIKIRMMVCGVVVVRTFRDDDRATISRFVDRMEELGRNREKIA